MEQQIINLLEFPSTAAQVSAKVDKLAQQVLPEHALKGFTLLPLRSRVLSVATFAWIGGDKHLTNQCLEFLRITIVLLLMFVPVAVHAQQQQPCSTDTDCMKKNGGDGAPAPTDAPKVAIYCGAPTKAGKPCRRRVKKAGEHCYQHRAQ